jgi:hypothetical protein
MRRLARRGKVVAVHSRATLHGKESFRMRVGKPSLRKRQHARSVIQRSYESFDIHWVIIQHDNTTSFQSPWIRRGIECIEHRAEGGRPPIHNAAVQAESECACDEDEIAVGEEELWVGGNEVWVNGGHGGGKKERLYGG